VARLLVGSLLTISATLCLAPFERRRAAPPHGAAAQILKRPVLVNLQTNVPAVPYEPGARPTGVNSLDSASGPKTTSDHRSTVPSAGGKAMARSPSYIELENRLLAAEAREKTLQQREGELERSNREIVRQLIIADEKVNREEASTFQEQAEMGRPRQENQPLR
jgi:hypothetical protein